MAPVTKTPTPPSSSNESSPSSFEHGRGLLNPRKPELERVPHDLAQRYAKVANLLNRMMSGIQQPARILEVGCNVWNLLPSFFDSQKFHVQRCDVDAVASDTTFFLIERNESLPVADESFDAVVALEVLEHVPRDRRRLFIQDCLRVAKHGAIFTCPNGVHEVVKAEAVAAAAYRLRHGVEHPFLQEHLEFGLPQSEEIVAILRDLDCPHAVIDDAPLPVWLAMMLLSENLIENRAAAELQGLISRSLGDETFTNCRIPYRKIYVCAKTFAATAVLEPCPAAPGIVLDGDELPELAAPLQSLAKVASKALCLLEERNQDLQRRHTLLKEQMRDRERRVLILRSYLQSLFASRLWKVLTPVREFLRLFRSSGFDALALIPWHDLERVEGATPPTWNATSPDPYFVVPCALPGGWVRLRLKMTSAAHGQWELFVDQAECGEALVSIKQGGVNGTIDLDECLYLPHSTLSLRFDPLNVPGQFCLERFEVRSVGPLGILFSAVRNKWSALRNHGLLSRALANGVGMLIRGRWRKMFHKLRDGLYWSRTTSPIQAAPLSNATDGDSHPGVPPHSHRTNGGAAVSSWEPIQRPTEYPDLQLDHPPTLDWSIVIPTINDCQRIVKCIESCRQQIPPGTEIEFIIVDDGTQAPQILRELERASHALRFRLLRNDQNLGFSATVNRGMREARGRFIVLCNNDIVFFQPWLEPMQQTFDGNPQMGIAGAKLLYPNGSVQHAGLEKLPRELRWQHRFGRWPAHHPLVSQSGEVWGVTGALLAVRREVLQSLGGFSGAYTTAYEDLDYCLRAWTLGVRVGYCAGAIAYHEEGGTRGSTPEQKRARSQLWAERERAGRADFERKWAWLREVENFEHLLPASHKHSTPRHSIRRVDELCVS